MNKEQQDKVWNSLPNEYKEYFKNWYDTAETNSDYAVVSKWNLIDLFGQHNLENTNESDFKVGDIVQYHGADRRYNGMIGTVIKILDSIGIITVENIETAEIIRCMDYTLKHVDNKSNEFRLGDIVQIINADSKNLRKLN